MLDAQNALKRTRGYTRIWDLRSVFLLQCQSKVSLTCIVRCQLSIVLCPQFLQGEPYLTANLYCICLIEHETCAVQICGKIWNAQYVYNLRSGFAFLSVKLSSHILLFRPMFGDNLRFLGSEVLQSVPSQLYHQQYLVLLQWIGPVYGQV